MTFVINKTGTLPGRAHRWSRFAKFAKIAVAAHFEKRRSRKTLSELDDEQLRDIGLSRQDASDELSKSWFWL